MNPITITGSGNLLRLCMETLLKWGLDFTGATAAEADFIYGDGSRVMLMPKGKWRCLDASGKPFSRARAPPA